MNENENKTYQNLWDGTKAVFTEKCMILNAYIKKEGRSQINNLTWGLKKLDKEAQRLRKEGIDKY